jgi:hypothetical protein
MNRSTRGARILRERSGATSTASADQVYDAINWAYYNDIQILTHANGEAAGDLLIAAIKEGETIYSPESDTRKTDLRWRPTEDGQNAFSNFLFAAAISPEGETGDEHGEPTYHSVLHYLDKILPVAETN